MKKDNKGFSLVELIIVIAIMAILIGVLAPTFIKYVERSRRSRDIQNASEIRTAIQADMADGIAPYTSSQTTAVAFAGASTIPTTDIPKPSSTVSGATQFTVDWNVSTGACNVYLGTYNLTDAEGAQNYTDA